MTIKWTESGTVKLVVLYGRYECLRNPFHPDFNKQLCCYKAYKQIVQSMKIPGLTVCDCVKRISFVKKQYCFELSKISAAISRGVFYKPKASWFEMMHELLFPYIQSPDSEGYSYFNEEPNNSIKECDCSQPVDDQEGNGDRCETESNNDQPIEDDCPCPPCDCPEQDGEAIFFKDFVPRKQQHHRSKSRSASKSRGSSKSPSSSTRSNYAEVSNHPSQGSEHQNKPAIRAGRQPKLPFQSDKDTNPRKVTYDRGNEAAKKSIDVSNRTSPTLVGQSEAQTERNISSSTNTEFERTEKAQSTTIDATPSTEDCSVELDRSGRKYKHHDEFDMFGKSIASQLRSLSLESAINLEKRIQDMMTKERLSAMKDSGLKTVVKTLNKESNYTCNYKDSCKECCSNNSDKDIPVCACGLPINKCLPPFPGKISQCYGFIN